jgi:hypothetical protein
MTLIVLDVQSQITFWNWPGWTFIGVLAAFIAAVATGLYTYFTYHLLASTKKSLDTANKLAEFQIYSKISDQLSSEKALAIFDIVERGWFEIEELIDSSQKVGGTPKAKLSGRDIRRYILSPMEDLAKFKDDGLLSMEAIDIGFGNTILMIGNSKPIVDYINYLRSKIYFSDDIHCGFQSLYVEELNICKGDERNKYKNHFESASGSPKEPNQ